MDFRPPRRSGDPPNYRSGVCEVTSVACLFSMCQLIGRNADPRRRYIRADEAASELGAGVDSTAVGERGRSAAKFRARGRILHALVETRTFDRFVCTAVRRFRLG